MKLSIIIVNYKVSHLLEKCLEKIQETEFSENYEIVVVDNDSDDGSQEMVSEKFPEVVFIQNSKNVGFARAVNKGVTQSRGEYILLLNPDTELHDGALSALISFYQDHPDAGVVGGKIINTDGSFQKQCRRNIPRPMPALFRLSGLNRLFPETALATAYELPVDGINSPHAVEAVSGALLCSPRKIWDEIGAMDEGYFLYGEDLDYCYRVMKAGYTNYYCPGAVAHHHHGASRKKRPVRTLWHTHYAMHRFYKIHLAGDGSILLKCCIISSIWVRWLILVTRAVIIQAFNRS